MKIGIYDPYLDTLGGGERYVSQIAKCLSSHDASLFWDDTGILSKIEERFGFSLSNVTVVNNIFSANVSLRSRLLESKKYDVIFFISDGSFPFLLTKKIYPILQFPITIKESKFKNAFKFRNISRIICYSEFVKESLAKNTSVPIVVINPAVEMIGEGKKENVILSVGRFTTGNNEKNQEMLIDFFQEHRKKFKNWKLILAGGVLPEEEWFVDQLKNKVKDNSIEIFTNISGSNLNKLYKKSKIYWHAAGYNKDILNNPREAEHFGITVVEAMSAGSVPIVFNGGGLTEIVNDGRDGYLWSNQEDLLLKTKQAMDSLQMRQLSKNAIERAGDFSEEKFSQKINELVKSR